MSMLKSLHRLTFYILEYLYQKRQMDEQLVYHNSERSLTEKLFSARTRRGYFFGWVKPVDRAAAEGKSLGPML